MYKIFEDFVDANFSNFRLNHLTNCSNSWDYYGKSDGALFFSLFSSKDKDLHLEVINLHVTVTLEDVGFQEESEARGQVPHNIKENSGHIAIVDVAM